MSERKCAFPSRCGSDGVGCLHPACGWHHEPSLKLRDAFYLDPVLAAVGHGDVELDGRFVGGLRVRVRFGNVHESRRAGVAVDVVLDEASDEVSERFGVREGDVLDAHGRDASAPSSYMARRRFT